MILKSRDAGIFPKGLLHGFGQNYQIPLSLFLAKIGQEKVFGNFLHRKLAFLDYKTSILKSRKNGIFSKTVSPWFWPKL